MSDLRDLATRSRRCGRCHRPFDLGEPAYEPGRYVGWTWPMLPVCRECAEELERETMRQPETTKNRP